MRAVRCAVGVKPVRQCTEGEGREVNSVSRIPLGKGLGFGQYGETNQRIASVVNVQRTYWNCEVLDVFPRAYTCGEVAGLFFTCTEPVSATGVQIPPKLSKWSIM